MAASPVEIHDEKNGRMVFGEGAWAHQGERGGPVVLGLSEPEAQSLLAILVDSSGGADGALAALELLLRPVR